MINQLETLSFQEILKKTPDIFEAVTVVSRRARQIISRRAAEQITPEDDYPDNDYVPDVLQPFDDYEEKDKAIVLAMNDYFDNRLKYRYSSPDDEEETAEESQEETTDF